MEIDNETLGELYKSFNIKNERCLAPSGECEEETINCHSVQNSKVLEQIAVDGHVIVLQKKIYRDKMPTVEFKEYSRNKATTFKGLCSKHDTEIFRPIDTQNIDENNNEHLFLMAYRSVLQEMTAQIEIALMVQNMYSKKVESGKISGDEFTQEGLMATEFIMRAADFNEYKSMYDKIYIEKDYNKLKHISYQLESTSPDLASSAVYTSIEMANNKDSEERIILNVFPSDEKQMVIFSCLNKDYEYVKPHIQDFDRAQGYYRKYILSKLILRNCANFVLSPRLYKKFSSEKKEIIKWYFEKTIYTDLEDYENKDLYLFD